MTAHDLLTLPARYRLRVADYILLNEAGAFEGMRTELIEGDVIVMNPQYRPHMFVKNELGYRLRRTLETLNSDLYVGTEGSVQLSDHDLPQPDIILTRDPRGDGPIPLSSIALLVEVADTSSEIDLNRKLAAYARHGIPEYWVADVNQRAIHQLWAPEGEGYTQRRTVAFGEPVTAATIEALRIETETL